jgi:AcrR family transcriptional regulator
VRSPAAAPRRSRTLGRSPPDPDPGASLSTEGSTQKARTDRRDSTRGRRTTRERILAAAFDLFVDRGFEGTTISAIERAVGLAAGTGSFYRHFPSKDAVFVASIECYGREHIDELLRAFDELHRVEDPAEWLGRYYRMRLDEVRRFGPVWRLIIAEGERFPDLGTTFTAALELDQWNLGWEHSPVPAIAMAALVGYANLAELEDSPYNNIAADDFIDSLVELVTAAGVLPPTRKG